MLGRVLSGSLGSKEYFRTKLSLFKRKMKVENWKEVQYGRKCNGIIFMRKLCCTFL